VTNSTTVLDGAIEEVKRRASADVSFRALALAKPLEALATVNPDAAPTGLALLFAEDAQIGGGPNERVEVLPPIDQGSEELSDVELENVAGGSDSGGSGMSGNW
jgi:hypothetical protein